MALCRAYGVRTMTTPELSMSFFPDRMVPVRTSPDEAKTEPGGIGLDDDEDLLYPNGQREIDIAKRREELREMAKQGRILGFGEPVKNDGNDS